MLFSIFFKMTKLVCNAVKQGVVSVCIYIYVCVGGPVIWLSLIFLVTRNHPESNASNLPLAVSQHFDHFTRQSPPLKDLETETTASSGSSPRGLEV
jgi:hypothetical protein